MRSPNTSMLCNDSVCFLSFLPAHPHLSPSLENQIIKVLQLSNLFRSSGFLEEIIILALFKKINKHSIKENDFIQTFHFAKRKLSRLICLNSAVQNTRIKSKLTQNMEHVSNLILLLYQKNELSSTCALVRAHTHTEGHAHKRILNCIRL